MSSKKNHPVRLRLKLSPCILQQPDSIRKATRGFPQLVSNIGWLLPKRALLQGTDGDQCLSFVQVILSTEVPEVDYELYSEAAYDFILLKIDVMIERHLLPVQLKLAAFLVFFKFK